MSDDEDARIGRYLERLAAFEPVDAPLDAATLDAIAAEVGVSQAARDRAAAAAIEHRVAGARALERGESDAAVEQLRHATELAPADHEAHRLLGDALRLRWHHGGPDRDNEEARGAYRRAQTLHWSPDVDRLRDELDGQRRADPGAGPPRAALPGGAKLIIAAGLGGFGVALLALLLLRVGEAPPLPTTRPRSPTATPASTPAATLAGTPGDDLAATAGAADGRAGLPRHEHRALPLQVVAGAADGLRLEAGGAEFDRYTGLSASVRLDAWLRWGGDDALTGLTLALELLAADGSVVAATSETVVHDFDPPAWPGDLLPVHIVPSGVPSSAEIASARLRVVSALRAPPEAPQRRELPLVWVVPTPAGAALRCQTRREERSSVGVGANARRSHGATIEVHNTGTVAIAGLQLAARYLDARGAPVHQSDNELVAPSYLPPMRPGDVRVFNIYESGLASWASLELAVQQIDLAPPTAAADPAPP